MLKDDIENAFNFQQGLLFAHSSNYRCSSVTRISAVTLGTVHELAVAGVFPSKKRSPVLLVPEEQTPLKWCLSSRHSTACKYCKRKINENTGSVCKTSECVHHVTSLICVPLLHLCNLLLANNKHCWKIKIFAMTSFSIQTFCTHYLYIYIYISVHISVYIYIYIYIYIFIYISLYISVYIHMYYIYEYNIHKA